MLLLVVSHSHASPFFEGTAEGIDLAVANQTGNLLCWQFHLEIGEGHGLLNGLKFLFEAGIFSRQVALQGPNADTESVGNVFYQEEAAWDGRVEFLLDITCKALLSDLLGQVLIEQVLSHRAGQTGRQ